MKNLNIIIAAHNAQDFILDCYDSIKNQKIPDNWKINILIGVDGCKQTARVLKKSGIPFYFSKENHGAYIIRNSLIYTDLSADAYSYFDADDVMNPGYIFETIKKLNSGADAVMCAKIQCNQFLKPLSGEAIIETGGAMTFTREVLEALGGYYRWRCAGDTDFMERAKIAGFEIIEIYKGLYMRRRHSGSLTKGGITKYGSKYRKQAWQAMTEKREQGIIQITPTVVKFEKNF